VIKNFALVLDKVQEGPAYCNYTPTKGNKMKAFTVSKIENEEFAQYNIVFETETELSEFVSQFPKYVKVYSSTISGMLMYSNAPQDRMPIASFEVSLSPDKVTGEANESGIKRLAKFHQIVNIDAIEVSAVRV